MMYLENLKMNNMDFVVPQLDVNVDTKKKCSEYVFYLV